MFNLSYAHFANAYRRYASRDAQTLAAELGWAEQGAQRASGALVEVLARSNSGASRPIHAVFYTDAQRDPRLRAWLDFLREKLTPDAL